MKRVQGILRRSARRAYLVIYDVNGVLRVLRLADMPAMRSGETVTVTGEFDGPIFRVRRAMPHRFARLARAA